MVFLEKIKIKWAFYFVLIVSLTLPFQFNLIKTNIIFDSIGLFYKYLGKLFFSNINTDWLFVSDSIALYVHVFCVAFVAFILSLIPLKISTKKIASFLESYCAYYLSLMLLIYGFNKLFKYQFYDPHPNTAYMPLGQLTKDFLYWTSIGSSLLYNRVTGCTEVIIAIGLWHRKTRIPSSVLAWLVLAHIVLINFAFDINVKIQGLFLLLVCSIILLPYIKTIITFYKGKASQLNLYESMKFPYAQILKYFIIVILISESLFPYIKSNIWNGDTATKPPYYGAYEITNDSRFKRFFIHSDPYFILQTNDDEFYSFKMDLQKNTLVLYDTEKQTTLNYKTKDNLFFIEGELFNTPIKWESNSISFKNLPVYKDDFNWFIEQVN